MKKILLLIAAIAATGLYSCKTTEANYRAAYETAAAKRANDTALDSATMGKLERTDLPRDLKVNGITLPVRTLAIGYDEEGGSLRDNVKRYNVVVGQFRQLFNAKEMRKRLLSEGYEGAMVIHDRQPMYYVVAATTDSPEEAQAQLEKVRTDSRISLKAPLPWILRPAHLAR